jgi:hypothetical protein
LKNQQDLPSPNLTQMCVFLQIVLSCVFGLDIIVSFFVGFYDSHGLLVMQNVPVAAHYARWAAAQ